MLGCRSLNLELTFDPKIERIARENLRTPGDFEIFYFDSDLEN